MSARITTPGIMSKVSPVTSSIATPRRITTRVALPSVTALVRRPRLVDPIAHHLKKGEGGPRGASHRPRVIILAAARTGVTASSAASDYNGVAAATLTFTPGETQKQVTVSVRGDTQVEPNGRFFLNVFNPTNATIADANGQGTIRNDDLSSSQSCTITCTSGNNVLTGTPGNDVICGLGGDDQLSGLGGRDVLLGGSGKDLALGGDDPDLLLGDTGYDDLRGQAGNDTLRGGEGGDSLLLGGSGSDALVGENGLDTLNTQDGVAGND